MSAAIITGIIRHILTLAGGWFVSNGVMTEADVEVAVGALVALIGVAWSIIEKRR